MVSGRKPDIESIAHNSTEARLKGQIELSLHTLSFGALMPKRASCDIELMDALSSPAKGTIAKAVPVLIWGACTVTILGALERGYEGPWYPLSAYIHRTKEAAGPYIYRVLFPFLAAKLEQFFPSMNDLTSFKATQLACIAVTVYLMGKWASLFLPKFGRLLGFMLVALMLAPTINYWNFYDIALTGFWTACLLLLNAERPVSYLLVFTLATLNHENILLLIPTAVIYFRGRMPTWKLAAFAIAQLVAWTCVRYLVVSSFPIAPVLFDNELGLNLAFWRHYDRRGYFYTAVVLFPWWALAAMGWKYAPRILRCAALSLPGLILVTVLFGKFDEVRQFDGFIPICIGFITCLAGSISGASSSLTGASEPVDAGATKART
jgi:hypothetical protein